MIRHVNTLISTLLICLTICLDKLYSQQSDSIDTGVFFPDSSLKLQVEELAKYSNFGFLIVHSNVPKLQVTSTLGVIERFQLRTEGNKLYEVYRVPLQRQTLYFTIDSVEIGTEKVNFSDTLHAFYYKAIKNSIIGSNRPSDEITFNPNESKGGRNKKWLWIGGGGVAAAGVTAAIVFAGRKKGGGDGVESFVQPPGRPPR